MYLVINTLFLGQEVAEPGPQDHSLYLKHIENLQQYRLKGQPGHLGQTGIVQVIT